MLGVDGRCALRFLVWSAAVAIPLIAAASQHSMRHQWGRGDVLYPWWSLAAGLHLILLGVLLWLESRPAPAHADQPAARPGRLFPLAILSVAAAYVLFLLFEVRRYQRMVWFEPINPLQADMLPIIQAALSSFWHEGVFPYRHVYVGHWSTWLTFQPGHWLPFSVPYLAGVDIRIWQMAALAATSFLLLFQGLWSLWRRPNWVGATVALVLLSIPIFLFRTWAFGGFLPALHVAGMWFTLAAWGVSLLHGYRRTAALFLGLSMLTRPYMVFAGPLYLIYLWHTHWRKSRKAGLIEGAITAAPFLLIMLPFLIVDGRAVVVGMLDAYEGLLAYQIQLDPRAPLGFALTGFLYKLDLFGWKRVGALALQGCVLAAALRWLRTDRDMLRFTAVSIFCFHTFAILPYFYIFAAPAVLLAIASPADGAQPPPHGPTHRIALVCSCTAFFGIYAFLIGWTVLRPPGHLPVGARGGNNELFASRLVLGGTPEAGWESNTGGYTSRLTGKHAYLAIPVRDRSFKNLEIEWDTREAQSEFRMEIAINHRIVGTLTLPPGEAAHLTRMVIPNSVLFCGSNLVRVSHAGEEIAPVALRRCVPMDPTAR